MGIPAETFFLDPSHQGTLQQQIRELIADAILTGRISPGEKLPSSRSLANHLGVSRITVTLAYTDLVSDDFLSSRGRSGYFVSETAPTPASVGQAPDTDTTNVDWGRFLGPASNAPTGPDRPEDWRNYKYQFIYGQTDPKLFDHQNWRKCALSALGQKDFAALTSDQYESDDPQLVTFLLRHILPRRGIAATADQVLLTLGAQNALWLSTEILLNQRRTAAIENPCYPGLREIVSQSRCNTIDVSVDNYGLPSDALPPETDVVFTTPSHHAPTNATMPAERRADLLKRAEADNFLIIEDDYEFEMSFLKPPTAALKASDKSGRVIYVGSFSKSLFPGLRLGFLVGPEPFIERARKLRSLVLRHPPGHIQRTVAYFLSLGHYDAQIRNMSRAYQERRQVMEQAINLSGLSIAGSAAHGGSSFWMRAPRDVDTDLLAERLREDGVLIEPGAAFFPKGKGGQRYYRIAYSSISKDDIPEGIRRIERAIRTFG